MGDWTDFIFGKKALKKAASTGDNSGTQNPPDYKPAGIDIGKMAQDQANSANKDNELKGVGPSTPKELEKDQKKKKALNAF